MTLPLVSIGVPTYNRAALLAQTLRMISAQDYPHLEVLVSDNHSEDDTEAVVRAAMAGDPRIRYVRQPRNVGLHRNLNFCLDQARGELVCLFMDDDQYRPTIVREYVEFLAAHPEVGLVCSDWEIVDDAGAVIDVREHRVPPVLPGLEYIDRTIRAGRSAVGCPGMMARRAALDEARFDDDGPIGFGDFVVWFRIAERWAIGHVARKLWGFRVHDRALSARPVHAIVADFEANVSEYCAGHLRRWPEAAPRVERWRRAMRRYIFWALVYEVGLDARISRDHRPSSGRHRTVFEIAGRRLTAPERAHTMDLLKGHRRGLGQHVAFAALSALLRLHVTAPLAWVQRYPESVRTIFGWR
jgi:glycosyltransferase involved in cell wall biosynthesis